MSNSLYDILGVTKSASTDEIRKAYRQRALETHPDKLDLNATDSERETAQGRFHKVHQAFETLSNPAKRKAYDRDVRDGHKSSTVMSDVLADRLNDREEWARKQQEKYKSRINTFREQKRLEKQEKQGHEEARKDHESMVKDMLQSLSNANPEWEERKRKLAQKRAERERTTLPKQPVRS